MTSAIIPPTAVGGWPAVGPPPTVLLFSIPVRTPVIPASITLAPITGPTCRLASVRPPGTVAPLP
jgi:hypothetical protein